MTRIQSKAREEVIEIDRIIGKVNGSEKGPTLIFFAGIHGNEPSGVFALNQLFKELEAKNTSVNGNIFAIAGNLSALKKGLRFNNKDLNRIWSKEVIDQLEKDQLSDDEEFRELEEIYSMVQDILKERKGPFYFLDLHTTSGPTIPFLTVNDSLLNRKFAEQYPIPMVLGIEEYLDGPLLSYINELGYVSFGFEAGQHDDPNSKQNHLAFAYITLYFTNAIGIDTNNFKKQIETLKSAARGLDKVYEIFFRYGIKDNQKFEMLPGFENFQKVHQGEKIAIHNGVEVCAENNGMIFMPLYQGQGEDGFFAIRRIPRILLRLSTIFRKIKAEKLLSYLPGVSRDENNKELLLVDRRVAKFFTKQFFHLMGFRSKRVNKNLLIMKNREYHSKKDDYKETNWY